MTPSALIEIAAKVEKLTGPDRVLDAEIAAIQGLNVVEEGHPLGRCCYDGNGRLVVMPRFTASLDAAKTLLAPGTLWAVGSMEDGPFARLCWPMPNGSYVGGGFEAKAATAPLAICAASLRALSQSIEGKTNG